MVEQNTKKAKINDRFHQERNRLRSNSGSFKIIVAHWLAERILSYSKKVFESSERNLAIWLHYQARAIGQGHFAHSVLNCAEGKCGIFRA
jgi:hypothetical protein